MKTFYLIRHAKSSWSNSSLRDIERPLNSRGLRDAPFMAKLLKGKGATPDQIISSPANRAHTTSKYFAEAFDIAEQAIRLESDIYEAYPEQVIEIIRGLDAALKQVLVFGHNPSFTSLANMFSEEYIANVSTCGIVKIVSTSNTWSGIDRANTKVAAYSYPKEYM